MPGRTTRDKRGTSGDIVVPDCKTDNRKNAQMHETNAYAKLNAHDGMTKCNMQVNDMATTTNNWETPGTSVSRRHNTPPLREDLVPRYIMALEGKWKRKRRGKTNCFFDKRVKPRTLRG